MGGGWQVRSRWQNGIQKSQGSRVTQMLTSPGKEEKRSLELGAGDTLYQKRTDSELIVPVFLYIRVSFPWNRRK